MPKRFGRPANEPIPSWVLTTPTTDDQPAAAPDVFELARQHSELLRAQRANSAQPQPISPTPAPIPEVVQIIPPDPVEILVDKVPERLHSAAQQLNTINNMNFGDTSHNQELRQRLLLTEARDVVETIQEAAKEIAIDAVRDGNLSRVQAAELLGVHQGTVGKWVRDRTGK